MFWSFGLPCLQHEREPRRISGTSSQGLSASERKIVPYYGGSQGEGTVFQLSPGANGTWLEQVILSFNYADGAAPYGGLVLDSTGVF